MSLTGLEQKKCLASVSIFREIYNRDKNIYDVLGEFLVDCLTATAKRQFTGVEALTELRSRFRFEVPEVVVKNALSRIPGVKRADNKFYFETLPTISDDLAKKLSEREREYEAVLTELKTSFFERYSKHPSSSESDSLADAFGNFLMDGNGVNSQYSKLISAFIIKHSQNPSMMETLSSIREGLLLYSGLQYSPQDLSGSRWDTELTLFLDTEILFSIGGLNGPLKQAIVMDFINLVREVNRKSQKESKHDVIELRYFSEVEKEVHDFFAAAESKVVSATTSLEFKPAMINILNGSKTKADVVAKLNTLITTASSLGVRADDDFEYYSDENHIYNLGTEGEAPKYIGRIHRNATVSEIGYALQLLGKINIRRKGRSLPFERARYYLVTANGLYHELGRMISKDKSTQTQLETTAEFITERIWVKLNKGFGGDNSPRSFSVIAKAQIVMANQLSIALGVKVTELELKVAKNEVDIQTAQLTLADYRHRVMDGAQISSENVDSVLEFSAESIDATVGEYEFAKAQFEQQRNENEEMKKLLMTQSERLGQLENERAKDVERKLGMRAVFRSVLVIGLPAITLVVGTVLIILRGPDWINCSLSILGLVSQILGIIRFFGHDFVTIKQVFGGDRR